ACTCTAVARRRYQSRLSGPLMDRVDLQVELPPLRRLDLLSDEARPESSECVRKRVCAARGAARERFGGSSWRTNAEVPGQVLRTRFRLPRPVRWAADAALERGELSGRGYDRVLRISWTLADLAGRSSPDAGDVGAAYHFRTRRAA
ncbi:MAG: ATP-binding protein, partial [Mycobacteriales bacterium]